MMPQIVAYLMIIVLANFAVSVFYKNRKNTKNDSSKKSEESAARHDDLVRKLDHEQEEASKHAEQKNRTIKMYEQVRKEHENDDDADENDDDDD